MPQIAFLTLFLGLTSGVQPVALSVVGDVAAIELRLDERAVARLGKPPWHAEVDLGSTLAPHTLEARALDGAGKELARVVQLVNLPRAAAEAQIQLEPSGAAPPRSARILWQNLTGGAPLAIAARLDGRPLVVGPGGRVDLPAVDSTTAHVLSAELRFSSGVVARRDAAFGGGLGTELRTEITAVAVRLPGRPKPEAQVPDSALVLGGRPAPIVGVETASARVLVVRDPAVVAPLSRRYYSAGVSYTGQHRLTPGFPGAGGGADVPVLEGVTVRFLWPQAQSTEANGTALKLFDGSRALTSADGSLPWLLGHLLGPAAGSTKPRYADAIAVAGLQALAANGRRAVVLVLGDEPDDPSHYDVATVVAYLRAVRVPLLVWRVVRLRRGAAPSSWGAGAFIGSPAALAAAAEALNQELAAQRIVWIDGAHAPGELTLSAAAQGAGLRFAGESSP